MIKDRLISTFEARSRILVELWLGNMEILDDSCRLDIDGFNRQNCPILLPKLYFKNKKTSNNPVKIITACPLAGVSR